MITIRKAVATDFDEIIKLCSEESKAVNKTNCTIYENQSGIASFANWICIDNAVYIGKIFVKEEVRRQQIASSVIKTILNNCQMAGVETAYIAVNNYEFAKKLKFNPINDNIINRNFEEIFFINIEINCFSASLTDYFSACCN